MAVSEQEFQQAERRMAAHRENGFAASARYDRHTARIVDLNTGVQIAFPTRRMEALAEASPDDLAESEISPAGLGLHWPKLDADVYVPALLQGLFGSKRWMAAEPGAAGGKVRSGAKGRGGARERPKGAGDRARRPMGFDAARRRRVASDGLGRSAIANRQRGGPSVPAGLKAG